MDKYVELKTLLSEKTKGLLTELENVNEITIPQTAFGSGSSLDPTRILYVSDIHIEAHMLSLGLDPMDKKALDNYITELVDTLFDEQIVYTITWGGGVSPDNMSDLLMGYYHLFIDETKNLTKKEQDELEWKLYRREINIPVTPRLQSCIVIDGDLADSLETTEAFFSCMLKRINCIKDREGKCCPIYFVLGNHEYIEFNDVEEANNIYKERLCKYGVTVLNNEAIEFGNCIIFGGTGFAKYNKEYNADNLVGPKNMNRNYEICESEKTNLEYENALIKAKDGQKPLIVISHYPIKDWMNSKADEHCYYFTGHNHDNSISVVNKSYIYADNQIGYYNNDVKFKEALIGTCYNPFIDYEDGVHEITLKQYSDFYKYTGEYVGVGLIRLQLKRNAKIYLIKQNGFFGFFVINDKNTKICAGGKLKVISEITDIRYFYECFCTMIYQYIAALSPLRNYQEKLSDMIRRLNIPYPDSGRIHGCIVDVDFYHHIMINPYDGKNTFYYSPYFGTVQEFKSFEALLESMESHDYQLKSDKKYLDAKKDAASAGIIKKVSMEKRQIKAIDIKDSLYSVSMKVNQLQRLFTSNILRDWDDSIIKSIVGEEIIMRMNPEKQVLSDYNLVQKSWTNLSKVPPEEITPSLVRCALDLRRKCYFPYTSLSRYGYPENKMTNEELRIYIERIPEKILKLFVEKFSDALGITFLEVFPLDILSEDDYDYAFSNFSYNTREVIETASRIPEEKWNEELGKRIAELITVKNKPSYCSKDLWDKIRLFKDKQ